MSPQATDEGPRGAGPLSAEGAPSETPRGPSSGRSAATFSHEGRRLTFGGPAYHRARIREAVDLLLDRYLAIEPRGGWIDRLDREGRPAADTIPASILYHLLVGFTELLRLEARLTG